MYGSSVIKGCPGKISDKSIPDLPELECAALLRI